MVRALVCLAIVLAVGCNQKQTEQTVSIENPTLSSVDAETGESPAGGESEAEPSTASTTAADTSETEASESSDAPAVADDDRRRDWTYWRGPFYNGVSYETNLPDDWDPKGGEGSNVAWKRSDLGTRSTPIVMNNRLYVLCRAERGTPRESERVVCVDATTGENIWENQFNVWLSDVPKERVGWSSVVGDVETGNVYALGVCGYFQCIDGKTGETIWSIPLHEKFGLLSTYGGRTNFPVICDDLVIISGIVIGWGDMAKPAHRFLGINKRTGEINWFTSTTLLPYDTTYSGPNVTMLKGQKALVFGSGDGRVWAMQPRTGRAIWQYEFSRRGINAAPVVVGDVVVASHSEENNVGTAMGGVVAIDGSKTGNISGDGANWRRFELMVGKCAPLVIDDRVYCFTDGGKLFVLDLSTGEQVGRRVSLGSVMRSSPIYADGKIWALAGERWWILEPDESRGAKVVKRGSLPRLKDEAGNDTSSRESAVASPICAHGRIYITTSGGIYCLYDKAKGVGEAKLPPVVAEAPVEQDTNPAHVQLVPAESLMQPGESKQFRARLFNSKGQFLKEVNAEYTVDGVGDISADGKYSAPSDTGQTAVIVHAKVGDLTGRSRIRVVPPLPWKFTFDDLNDAPVTWVGARYRHALREVDGNKVLVKVTTIPKGTRSRAWFGHPDLKNYTIQADVKGSRTNDKMPDIGLIAQGYAIDMQGASQQLQIRSWVTELRMAKTIPFAWEGDKWYTMKFQASTDGKTSTLRGKVWPRGEAEPAEWMIEAVDDQPRTQGSPGMFGNAKDAEIFLDNISVTPNTGTVSPTP